MRIYKTTSERLREAADEIEKLRQEVETLRKENERLKALLSQEKEREKNNV